MKTKFSLFLLVLTVMISGCKKDPFVDADSGTFRD